MFVYNYDYIWYERLYQGHILLGDNPFLLKTYASCYISLGKISETENTFGRGGWNSMGNLATKAIVQNIQEIPTAQTVQSVL